MKDKKIFNILGVYRKVQVLRWGGGDWQERGGGVMFLEEWGKGSPMHTVIPSAT